MRQLILGGARSGKSRIAQDRVEQLGTPVVYIATATVRPDDQEMCQRIELHRNNRPKAWQVLEVPVDLPQALARLSGEGKTVLVDCLTLWLTNLLLQNTETMQQGMSELVSVVDDFEGNLILVSNEVGWGIVPMGELSRTFQDNTGRLHQDLAVLVERVSLCVAGIPMDLKNGERNES
ncbi:bifunctional adenosylcobinamide kinase/adenosylcobinamide-phosphate guanylyltransferase [uncultured Neptuniibacter sp.]|uniref:bifunctional adenosylcobinamide kinase/adenosylcobinamide-phosphate guanylyltransferase n=1 Tax=uncultured Neptuniibacter sp. TaxID=502143 RepID=UPI002608F4F9|nr:bifunctional adenosylcobinamide kinase/adenosylcobinamide-phosphate guanylyltransferase [uncultured Neptuniibacter sp.]